MMIRPRRSVLYMPGSNQRALEKTRTLAADVVVFDLEDSVGPEKKALAREQILAAVEQGGYGERELVIRINAVDSPWWLDDIAAVASATVHAVCLPKVEQVNEIDAVLDELAQHGAVPSLGVWVMIETPAGVINIDRIAAHDRVNVIVMGTTDLAKELRVPHTEDRIGLLPSLGRCVLGARAAGAEILDGVYLDLNNEEGFTRVCRQGRELGFDGKTLIHPKQLAAANRCFGPRLEDVEHAKAIIQAWQQADAEGNGVAVVDGKLIEVMHVDEAKRLLAMAEIIQTV